MTEFVNALIDVLLSYDFDAYVMVFLAVCVFLSHLVQYLPVSVTEKVPNLIMVIINALAAKHGAILSARTDIKGNRIE